MAIVSVMYPGKPGSKFDMEYYLHKHMTMVAETWGPAGLRSYQVLKGHPGADGAPPAYQVIVNMDFSSAEAFQAAVAQSGAKVMGDVPNFTDLQPTLQVSDVADSYPAKGGAL